MKKLLLLISGSLLSLSLISFNVSEDYVYICKGPYSKRFHLKKDCSGLKNCSTDIYKVTLTEAKSIDRTLCKLED